MASVDARAVVGLDGAKETRPQHFEREEEDVELLDMRREENPKPQTLHRNPYTLSPKPSTLRLDLYTLNPNPEARMSTP